MDDVPKKRRSAAVMPARHVTSRRICGLSLNCKGWKFQGILVVSEPVVLREGPGEAEVRLEHFGKKRTCKIASLEVAAGGGRLIR